MNKCACGDRPEITPVDIFYRRNIGILVMSEDIKQFIVNAQSELKQSILGAIVKYESATGMDVRSIEYKGNFYPSCEFAKENLHLTFDIK